MSGVGMPEHIRLEEWARRIRLTLGGSIYLVGSAARGKEWRDVDVRLMLDDEHFERLFPGIDTRSPRFDPRWTLLCEAIALHGREATGLPIDFQIQDTTRTNERYGAEPRDPLDIRIGRRDDGDDTEVTLAPTSGLGADDTTMEAP